MNTDTKVDACGALPQTPADLENAMPVTDRGALPGAAAPAVEAPQPLVCSRAAAVLRLSKGRRRVPVENLGPALFNRFATPLSGKHILSLAHRILKVESFATYRYVSGWCHEPNPADPLEVARRALRHGATDPVLPRYPMKALHGVFSKNHLVALLQLIKQGGTCFSGSSEKLAAPCGEAHAELRDVLEHGIEMDVFSFKDVENNKDAFMALMASDNFDAAFTLAEDEFALMGRLSACSRTLPASQGSTIYEETMSRVVPLLGNRWTQKSLDALWAFCVATDPSKLSFMQLFSAYMHDSKEFRIRPHFFEIVGALPFRRQALRLSLIVAQVSSDPVNETQDRGGPLGSPGARSLYCSLAASRSSPHASPVPHGTAPTRAPLCAPHVPGPAARVPHASCTCLSEPCASRTCRSEPCLPWARLAPHVRSAPCRHRSASAPPRPDPAAPICRAVLHAAT